MYHKVNVNKHFLTEVFTVTNHYRDQRISKIIHNVQNTYFLESASNYRDRCRKARFLEGLCYLMWSLCVFSSVEGIASVERIPLLWKTGAIAQQADIHYLSPPFSVHRLSCKCISIRELSMKKSVRPAVNKVSGDRGKAEATATTGTGKSTAKTSTTAPLSKVRIIV